MHWTDLFNSVGSLFIVATASTKTMVPLRILAIVANCFLIAFYAGHILERTHSYSSLFVLASSVYLLALALVVLLAPKLRKAEFAA